jgi:hypothetical protein
MTARRLRLGILAWVCVLAGGLALGGVSAQALVTHQYLSQITEVPSGSGVPVTGLLSEPYAMTFDSGHLWLTEHIGGTSNTFRVDEFDAATGAFVSQLPQVAGIRSAELGVAVGHGSGEGQVYVGAVDVGAEAEGRVEVFGEAGAPLARWTGANTPTGPFGTGSVTDVAVDNSVSGLASGSVYVVDQRQRVVDVFKPEGVGKEAPVSEPSSGHVKQLTGTCPVEGTTCEPLEVIPFKSLSHVTVDDSSGNVLVLDSIEEEVEGSVVQRAVVDVFEPEALGGYVFVRQIKLPVGEQAHNLAVDGGNGDLYVAASTSQEAFVDQFSSTGVFLGRITGEGTPAGDFRSTQPVAVDPGSHHVFVGDYRGAGVPSQPAVVDVFGPSLVIPDVTTGPASNVTPYKATLNGTVKLDGEGVATCQFVWGTTSEFGQVAPCLAPASEEASPVQASLTGLEPDTTYFYRLQAINKNNVLNAGEPGQDQQFTTSGPGIHGESVSNVAATSVTFDATIDPHNAPTTSYFQYGTSSAYGLNVPAAPGLSLGSGAGDVEAIPQHVQGLSADTVYHYRVVVVSEPSPGVFEEFDGPDQTFTTQQSSNNGESGLPDGRMWEMVTPPQKEGALFDIEGPYLLIQASVAGNAIEDLASQPIEAEPQGNPPDGVSVLSTRGSEGWSSQAISPPHEEQIGITVGEGSEYRFFSEDLSKAIVQPFGNFVSLSPEATESTAYLYSDYLNGDVNAHCHTSCFTPLVTAGNTPPGTVFGWNAHNGKHECIGSQCGPYFDGATPDLSHVILDTIVHIAPGNGDFYEWANGKLTSTEGVAFGSQVGHFSARHALSDDGLRIVGSGESEGLKGLLMRDMVKGKTVRLDLPQGGTDTGSVNPADYMTASSDDSTVFFLDKERLTAESSASSDGSDLYEYDLNAPLGSRLTDLTVDRNRGELADVAQVVGASEDGSYVYFAASGALAPGATHGECGGHSPPPGDKETCNLYVIHAGVTRFVAGLSPEDYPDWGRTDRSPVRVSPNGQWLTFMSKRDLTGYDTHDAVSGHPDSEVYLYDASSNKLVCASCNRTGARPVGVNTQERPVPVVSAGNLNGWAAATVPVWTHASASLSFYQPRYLFDNGRLFFNGNDALVSGDVNGTWDVYQYEPPGVGDCSVSLPSYSERSGGCVGLISSGASPEESAFLDASATGGDVFFLTTSKLASQDFDKALDVYDAHECTSGSPCFAVPPGSPPACSTGDACKAAPSPQPALFGAPSSATFSGAGNVTPSASGPVLKAKPLTRSQKLARALRVCTKKHVRAQRKLCQRRARKRYGAAQSRKANARQRGGR